MEKIKTENVSLIGLCLESNTSENAVMESMLEEIASLSKNGFISYYAPWDTQVRVFVHVIFFVGDTPQQASNCWLFF